MGKAIKNFKDSLSGVEEASYKRLQENSQQQKNANPASDSPANRTETPENHA
jgi:Sec-independent protein translocase protein TatA